jgi:aldose 1-epimerase
MDRGFDHNYVLKNNKGLVGEAGILQDRKSGRHLRVLTNQPGIQLYTANWFDGKIHNGSIAYNRHCAVALETQDFPDAPNHAHFPSTLLLPKESYDRCTIYQFSTMNKN